MTDINPVEPLPWPGIVTLSQSEDITQKASRRLVARAATLDPHNMVGLWSTGLWILAAAVLLATFGIH